MSETSGTPNGPEADLRMVLSMQREEYVELRKQEQEFRNSFLKIQKQKTEEQKNEINIDSLLLEIQKLTLRELKISSRSTIILTSIMAFATLGLFFYTKLLSVSTEGIRSYTQEQTKKLGDSIFEATRQAIAAEKANQVSTDNSQLQLRSYVIETNFQSYNILNSNLLTKIFLKNVGQTPAYNLAFYSKAAFIPLNKNNMAILPFEYKPFCSNSPGILGQYPLGSSSTEPTPLEITRSDEFGNDIEKYSKESLRVFTETHSDYVVWGIACYKDIFHKSHYKKFCRYYNSLDNLRSNIINACKDNNESD